ncbi:MAG: NAD(P)/FAD-dependent oxidoreductase [Methanoregula sp.]|nr:NAD(P)/FAD-dependent oxidoreductase [Methanoregula sp.]
MKIGIIGGGVTGLSSACALLPDNEIEIFEKMPFLGGCLSSYRIDEYWIERYYHHCFTGDRHLFSLLEDLGLSDKLEWRTGTTGYYANNTLYPLNSPLEILNYPELSLLDKARLALLTLRSKNMDLSSLDDVSAEEFIVNRLGRNIYRSFFEPLLKSKFGDQRKEVSAAWLISRIAIRSDRGVSGEHLGYLNGGFHTLIDSLERSIERQGGKIQKSAPAASVTRSQDKWEINGKSFDAVISTIPPRELERIGGPVIPVIPYQGAACVTLGMDREVTKGIYWLNMKDPAPYGAVVTHTNFIPSDRYGEHLVYLASYFSGSLPHDSEERMLDDFCARFSVGREEIHWHKIAVDPWAGPVYSTGYRSLIPDYEQHGLYMAGMFSLPNYPERSMEGSIRAGIEVADKIKLRGS